MDEKIRNRRILISLLVIIIACCVVVSLFSILGAGYLIWSSEPAVSFSPDTEAPQVQEPTQDQSRIDPNPTAIHDSTEQERPLEDPSELIPPEVLVEMELIQRQVREYRGLETTGVFTRVLLTKNTLQQRVLDDFLEDYSEEEAKEDAIVLEAFGLLDSSFDLFNFYYELLSEQIAGFYDNETKEMVIVQGAGFEGTERLTYAHEYTHALQDQNFDFKDGLNYNDEACEEDSERCAAIQALLEGDASLSELNWFQNFATAEDKADIFSFLDSYQSPVLDSSPAFISEDFLFPYENGLTFVQYLYDHGGWDAIDEAYLNLPASTEQILHPEKYPGDAPISISLPGLELTIGEDWQLLDQGVMGEWYTYLILAHGLDPDARLNDSDSASAAAGWEGDSYVVYYEPENDSTIMVLRTLWDSQKEANEFFDAFKAYARERFGKPVVNNSNLISWENEFETHYLHIEDSFTTWILAPDANLANQIWTMIDTSE